MEDNYNILVDVLEDQEDMLEAIGRILQESGLKNYRLYDDPGKFLENLDRKAHIVISDYRLPGTDGMEILKKVRSNCPGCKTIMISMQDSLQIALALWNHGAFRYVNKADKCFSEDLPAYVRQAMDEINKEEEEAGKQVMRSQLIEKLTSELNSIRRKESINP